MTRYIKLISLAALAAVITTSCEDDFDPGIDDTGNMITFNISGDDYSASRSSEDGDGSVIQITKRYTNIVIDGDTMQMCITEMPNNDVLWEESDASEDETISRGAPISNNQFNFGVKAITAGNALYFENSYTYNSSSSTILTDRYWPNLNTTLSFFGYAANCGYWEKMKNGTLALNCSHNTAENKLSFNYKLPDPATNTNKDAEAQPDLIFAIAANKTKPATTAANQNVKLVFHHALSAVNFKIGTIRQDITVKTIKLINMINSGTCTATANNNNQDGSKLTFAWTYPSDAKYDAIYTQTFNEKHKSNQSLNESQCTFMLVPHTLKNAQLEMKFTVEGNGFSGTREYTLSKEITNLFPNGFKPDMKYVITIGISREEVGIEVDDKVSGATKYDVKIKNTGFAAGYVRAAIVGFWKNSKGDILVPWSDGTLLTNQSTINGKYGTFTIADANAWNNNWKKGSDGFYYTRNKVQPATYTSPLFTKYTITKDAPVTNAVLEMNIIAQIVNDNGTGIKTIWGNYPW